MDLPSRQALLSGAPLTVPPVQGDPVEDPSLLTDLSEELAALFGGWFERGLQPFISLHRGFLSQDTREWLSAGGVTASPEAVDRAVYWLGFEMGPWAVQGAGEASEYHCLSIIHPLSEEEAIGPGGHPKPLPLGSVEQIWRQAAPRLCDGERLEDFSSAQLAPNVFDAYMTGPGVTVRGGVRRRAGPRADRAGSRYHYTVRIDVVLSTTTP
jgi:hypothetical protein